MLDFTIDDVATSATGFLESRDTSACYLLASLGCPPTLPGWSANKSTSSLSPTVGYSEALTFTVQTAKY